MMHKKIYTVNEIKRKIEQYCVYQDRCHKEVEQKIREYQLIPEARELILLSLMKDNFLNEERFARSFAIYRITENRNAVISESNSYKRKQKLIGFLMRKGFENELIYKVVTEIVA